MNFVCSLINQIHRNLSFRFGLNVKKATSLHNISYLTNILMFSFYSPPKKELIHVPIYMNVIYTESTSFSQEIGKLTFTELILLLEVE